MRIFNGMFNPVYGYARAIAGIILGALLIIWPDVAPKTIVQIMGCFLVAIGAISFIVSIKKDKAAKQERQSNVDILSINGIFDLFFGLILLIFPSVFVTFVMFLLGLLLCIFGIGQIVNLFSAKKVLLVAWEYYILPVITTICGIVVMCKPFDSVKVLFIIFGVALIIYGVSELISTIKLRKAIKYKQSYEYRVEDSGYEDVSSEQK